MSFERVGRNLVRLVSLALLAAAASACALTAEPARPPVVPVAPPRVLLQPPSQVPPENALAPIVMAPLRIRVTDARGTRIVTLSVDEYVAGCVRAELPPEAAENAPSIGMVTVQAIVSRTYAIASRGRHEAEGFDLCDGTHCQLHRALAAPGSPDLAARATEATRGQIITFAGRPILAVFHSNCGGHTADARTVWGGQTVPYLLSVGDESCANTPGARWEFTASSERLRDALNNAEETRVGQRLDRIEVVDRDGSGRATLVAPSGERTPLVRAEEFRTVLCRTFGPRSLKSTIFSLVRRGDQFVFSGVGYGHGVGLCQAGAAMRARAGEPPSEILAHYFPGTAVQAAADSRGAVPGGARGTSR